MARTRKYDWQTLFAKKNFTMEYGTDFKVSGKAMLQQIKNAASAIGLLLEIETVAPSKTVPKLLIKVKVLP